MHCHNNGQVRPTHKLIPECNCHFVGLFLVSVRLTRFPSTNGRVNSIDGIKKETLSSYLSTLRTLVRTIKVALSRVVRRRGNTLDHKCGAQLRRDSYPSLTTTRPTPSKLKTLTSPVSIPPSASDPMETPDF